VSDIFLCLSDPKANSSVSLTSTSGVSISSLTSTLVSGDKPL